MQLLENHKKFRTNQGSFLFKLRMVRNRLEFCFVKVYMNASKKLAIILKLWCLLQAKKDMQILY